MHACKIQQSTAFKEGKDAKVSAGDLAQTKSRRSLFSRLARLFTELIHFLPTDLPNTFLFLNQQGLNK